MSESVSSRDSFRPPPASSTRASAKTARVLAKYAIKVVGPRAAAQARLDPRARALEPALLRDQADPARAQPAHRVRGSLLPEHRRVLRQGHGDLHDPGRHLHAALPVLRRRPRPAAAARCRGAAPTSPRRSPRSKLAYVVITSVDRDDLRDGGAQHFVDCIRAVRETLARTRRSRSWCRTSAAASSARSRCSRGAARRDEPQPRDRAAPLPAGATGRRTTRIRCSCCRSSRRAIPEVPTKSGLMVGLGETDEEILAVMRDLRAHDVDMLTIGQYLQPSRASPAGRALRASGHVRDVRARGRRSASGTPRSARWCARRTTPTSRRTACSLEPDVGPVRSCQAPKLIGLDGEHREWRPGRCPDRCFLFLVPGEWGE